ncbi:fructose-1,6-bisphosphatase, chloroplastic [Rhodamnia argentea]|uniref:fructose-bisphosphatase n=1 Tax=Rhodamnia argentea TaxID=178133 RepID=A0ABM3GVB2_9MYRT|nr:fructose-1,6-bisphosphatase, chloroplastic [Rhodamnia argentea]XP_048128301.1 fructose-1,6-bisphosphatase, chloroplastic [Rhodamnia argentea]
MQLSTTLEYPLPSTSPKSLLFNPKTQNFGTLPNFPVRNRVCTPKMASLPGFSVRCRVAGGATESQSEYRTLVEFVGTAGIGVGDDLVLLFDHIQYACKRIASLVASPFNSSLGKQASLVGGVDGESGRDAPKPLDIVSNEIILSSLRNSGKVAVMASEEDDAPVWITDDGPFVVVTDPLDGSRNIDASIPTGTIFGIYNRLVELDHLPMDEKAQLNSLQSGTRLVASAYVLYSSATILCATFGSGTHAFTLDQSTGDFILTHPNIKIPPRGQIYSVNDARYFDWPNGLRRYIDTVRQGKGRYPKKYSARYICSLVADFHRTLLYGGVAMNPRDHLRLVYEANPLSFLVEQAGGKGSDGKSRILSIQPVKLHQRLPLFLGSPEDIEELESYGDVQQKVNPGYEV